MNKIKTGYIRSPINYMGGKFRSLKHIIPNFPSEIDTFYDVFSGSGTVHLNTKARKKISNDINHIVIQLQEYISKNDPDRTYENLTMMSAEYNLKSTNSDGYVTLRRLYNKDKDPLKLLALSQHSFNCLIRFNGSGEFNASHGKGISSLSQDYLSKLVNFKSASENTVFVSEDFRDVIDFNSLSDGDLVYCDPPYLLSEAVYNEKRAFGGWAKEDSLELFELLDEVHDRGAKFALTEMIQSKGLFNEELANWVKMKGYSIRYNNVKYLGVPSTHKNDKKSIEVLVTNY